MRHGDTRHDHLERIGDDLPTPEEMAELNAYHDRLDREAMLADLADAAASVAGPYWI